MNEGDKVAAGATFSGSLHDIFEGIHGLLKSGNPGPLRVVYIECGAAPATNGAENGASGAAGVPATSTGDMAGSPAYTLEWNLQGHAVIAYMAEQILQDEAPETYRALLDVIAADPFNRGDVGDLAMWPDRIKHPPPKERDTYQQNGWVALGKQTQPWHFIDIPYHPGTTGEPEIPGGDDTILGGLPSQLAVLAARPDPERTANALGFVLHLVGDLHQPLHCACLATEHYKAPKFDMGGNLVTWSKSSSLHALWDDSVAAKASQVASTTAKLLERFPRSAFDRETSQDLTDWARDSHMIARKAYDRFLAETTYDAQTQRYTAPSKAYRAWALDVCQERAALAAYRLADLLVKTLRAGGNGHAGAGGNGHAKAGGNGHAKAGGTAKATGKTKRRRR
jgi:hypothetical protein